MLKKQKSQDYILAGIGHPQHSSGGKTLWPLGEGRGPLPRGGSDVYKIRVVTARWKKLDIQRDTSDLSKELRD